jgi:hypothetical protein
MPSDTLRYKTDDARLPAAVYWRRRFLALLAGIATVGMIAWAMSGVLSGGGTGSNAADVSHPRASGTAQGGAAGAAAPDAHAASTQAASTQAAGTQEPATQPPGTPAPGTSETGSAVPSRPGPGVAPAGVPSCTAGDVVISLTATQAAYGQSQPPEFDVYVVSTAAGTCSFNVGPRYLAVLVTNGSRRVWGSADCAAAPGSLVTDLARGVPVVLPVSWDLQTSAPGCRAAAGQATAGSYTATAAGDGMTSSPVTFRLG